MTFPGHQLAFFPSSTEACVPAVTPWQVASKLPIPHPVTVRFTQTEQSLRFLHQPKALTYPAPS